MLTHEERRKKIIKWAAAQDFTLCDTRVAEKNNMRPGEVRRRRIIAGIPQGVKGRKVTPAANKCKSKPKNINWDLTDGELAKKHNRSTSYFYLLRMQMKAPRAKFAYGSKLSRPYNLDWEQNDATLGRKHGVTRERIRQIRKETKAPRSKYYGKHSVPARVEWQAAVLQPDDGTPALDGWQLSVNGRTLLMAVSLPELHDAVTEDDRKLIGRALAGYLATPQAIK